jgi:hypothetical protein
MTIDVEALQRENADLRARVELAEAAIAELRAEALQRRQDVRDLVAELPAAMSRATLLRQVARDVVRHPDKRGVLLRAVGKARRAVRKALPNT